MPAEGDVKWKNTLVLFYSISFGFVYPCIYATLFPKDFLEVELFEQRPGIPAGQGRRPGAAVPPGGLAPQPWGPAAGSDPQSSNWAPEPVQRAGPQGYTAKAAALVLPLARRMTVSLNHPDTCVHGQEPAVSLSVLALRRTALLF